MSSVQDLNQQPSIRNLHKQAMDIAELAFAARIRGDFEQAKALARQALAYETKAAELVAHRPDAEPTRSILHRSAASLALQCEEISTAEHFIYVGLSGNPPREIAEELKDLLEQVDFIRHLNLHGMTLEPREFQLSLAGKGVGFGIAPGDKLIEKLQSIQKLIYRTIDRLANMPFQDVPASPKDYSLFVSTPRAGSFALSISIGRPEQPRLPGFDDTAEIVDEILRGIELLNSNKEEQLKKIIPDEAYYTNFVALTRKLAPDGDEINYVGLTALRGGIERQVVLARKQDNISLIAKGKPREEDQQSVFLLKGQLLYADSTKRASGQIRLVDETGKRHSIIVPPGMMSDIVKPLWEETVEVRGRRIGGGKIELEDIRPAS